MLTVPTLQGTRVRLEPLAPEHVAGLAAAAAGDRSAYAFTRVPDGEEEARRYVLDALDVQAAGGCLAHAVRRLADGRVVGTTRFWDLEVVPATGPPPAVAPRPSDDLPPTVLEIGSTWYAASAQRTGVNTEVKLLQLTHAFGVWGALRVCFRTDARNTRSRRAIERLGARPEGVRRAHCTAADGTVRDTAFYSVLAPEWPGVRDRLRAALAGR
ncbi:GNAT family protein [Kineococcus sp. NUM-3379]